MAQFNRHISLPDGRRLGLSFAVIYGVYANVVWSVYIAAAVTLVAARFWRLERRLSPGSRPAAAEPV